MARIGVGVSRRDPQRWANLRVGPPEGSQARLSSGGEPVEGRASIPARTAGSLAGGKADREGARAHRVTEGSGLPTGAGTPDREGGSGRGLGFSREARPGRGRRPGIARAGLPGDKTLRGGVFRGWRRNRLAGRSTVGGLAPLGGPRFRQGERRRYRRGDGQSWRGFFSRGFRATLGSGSAGRRNASSPVRRVSRGACPRRIRTLCRLTRRCVSGARPAPGASGVPGEGTQRRSSSCAPDAPLKLVDSAAGNKDLRAALFFVSRFFRV